MVLLEPPQIRRRTLCKNGVRIFAQDVGNEGEGAILMLSGGNKTQKTSRVPTSVKKAADRQVPPESSLRSTPRAARCFAFLPSQLRNDGMGLRVAKVSSCGGAASNANRAFGHGGG